MGSEALERKNSNVKEMREIAGELTFATVILAYAAVAPFTKVEESFNVQAMHDWLYTDPLDNFDHITFPGVVPRTSVPAFITAACVSAFRYVLPKCHMLLLCRFAIGLASALSLGAITRRVNVHFGRRVAVIFVLLTCSQPHLMFYASRPLPNTMALPLVLLALSYYPLSTRVAPFICLSAFSILIVRSELCLLMGAYLLWGLVNREITFPQLIINGAAATVAALACTVPFDSFFWRRLMWPEGVVFQFNALQGRSQEWGVLPFWWYFESALPRAPLLGLLFLPFGLGQRATTRILAPALFFIFIYSFNGHKELRFILYAIPMINIVAAVGLERLWQWLAKWKTLGYLVITGILCVNLVASLLFVIVSSLNYPGGVAFAHLHQHLPCDKFNVSVHITNLAAQTGVTRFGEECKEWTYDKSEGVSIDELAQSDFTHLIVENKEETVYGLTERYRLVRTFDQYHKIRVSLPPGILYKESLVLLERRDLMEKIVPKEMIYEQNYISDEL